MITSEEMKRKLWEGANDLRGSMDASKYKDYMLGLMFYKFLSDKTLETFKTSSNLTNNDDLLEEYSKARKEYGSKLDETIQSILGYYVLPEHLYHSWLKDIRTGDFELQKVMDSLNNFERTIAVTSESDDFKGLFSSSIIDLTSSALGSDLNKRSKNIKDLILLFSDINMADLQEGDILGDAYEYLIGQFASNAGKKAGEFYTPRQVSEVMAQIIAKTTDVSSIYDPTVGSGSLLLTVRRHLSKDKQKKLSYYGQEYITETYNITRMNLLLHGVRPEKMNIKNGNTLAQDWPEDPEKPIDGVLFDAVVMNPPYSDKKWNKREEKPLKISDPRFADFGVLPPDGKGDFAYLMHGLYHLGQKGSMAIVLPHGVLFRGAAEGEIRKRLIDKNYIDAIIGLPNNLFTNTGIPVCVIILKKNRQLTDPILIIDGARDFIKVGKQNVLQEKDIARIVDTYCEKIEIKGYSHLATRDEIVKNEYNMNIPRYVEERSSDIPHDVDGHLLGGIPAKNIEELELIQSTAQSILEASLIEVRSGYVELNTSIQDLTNKIFGSENFKRRIDSVKKEIEKYIAKYWGELRNIDKNINLEKLKEEMLTEIKELLSNFEYIDIYEGYQIVAEIWKNYLLKDTELISNTGFYKVAKVREPFMVEKGQGEKKRAEQDGWVSATIPSELIAKKLYGEKLKDIEKLKENILEIDNGISDFVEMAKEEDNEQYSILYDCLKKDEDDNPQDAFDSKKIKEEIKRLKKDEQGYSELKKVEELTSERKELSKKVAQEESNLKAAIQERILNLSDAEIDELIYEKWFGDIVMRIEKLVEEPLRNEISILEMLSERYTNTLSDIDEEIKDLESAFEELAKDLVICE